MPKPTTSWRTRMHPRPRPAAPCTAVPYTPCATQRRTPPPAHRPPLPAAILVLTLALLLPPPQAAAQDPWSACTEAAQIAEREAALPAGLLTAIGLVESGRTGPGGRATPWPFSVNIEGAGRWFDTAPDAIEHVRTALQRGLRSIDVGCFQINLQHHPAAFASLEHAFDPALNAAYAARLLAAHYAAAGTWEAAAGRYHSLTPFRAEPYAARVLAAWHGAATSTTPAGPANTPSRLLLLPVVWRPASAVPSPSTTPARTPAPRLVVPVYVPGAAGKFPR